MAGTSLRPDPDVGSDRIKRCRLDHDVRLKMSAARVPTIQSIEQDYVFINELCEHHRMVDVYRLITAVATRFYLPCATYRFAIRVTKYTNNIKMGSGE
jgi:hypothetical protein